MPERASFEEMVLAERAREREKYGAAMAAEKGRLPFGKDLTEQQQDELWMELDPQWADPAQAMQLIAPKEQGGMSLTPLAASLVRYPRRRDLYEGEGPSIEDHIRYANRRRDRIAKKQATPAEPAPEMPALPEPPAQEGY